MDAEKLSQTSSLTQGHRPVTNGPKGLKYIRALQHVMSTISLVFIACAVDRNILQPGVSTEEQAIIASVSLYPQFLNSTSYS